MKNTKPDDNDQKWTLNISQNDQRLSALSHQEQENIDTHNDVASPYGSKSAKAFKRQLTEKEKQNHLPMPVSDNWDAKLDQTSAHYQTNLSFPSDFTKRAGEIQQQVRAGEVVNKVKAFNKRLRPDEYISTPPSAEALRERSVVVEKSSAKKRRDRSIMTRSNSSRRRRERARLSPFRNMPNNGNRGGVMLRNSNRNRR